MGHGDGFCGGAAAAAAGAGGGWPYGYIEWYI